MEIVGRLAGRGLQTPAQLHTGSLFLTKSKAVMNPVRVVEPTIAKNLNNLIDLTFLCLLLQMCFSRPSHFC